MWIQQNAIQLSIITLRTHQWRQQLSSIKLYNLVKSHLSFCQQLSARNTKYEKTAPFRSNHPYFGRALLKFSYFDITKDLIFKVEQIQIWWRDKVNIENRYTILNKYEAYSESKYCFAVKNGLRFRIKCYCYQILHSSNYFSTYSPSLLRYLS